MTEPVINHLNAELATAFILSLNAKRYHWMVTGPHFRDYHLRFDDLYQAVDATVDELAERVRMLGGTPIHTPGQIERFSQVTTSDPGSSPSAPEMVKEALLGEERIIAYLHEGIDLASSCADPGTADLLTRFVQVHQKEAWFLRSMLA